MSNNSKASIVWHFFEKFEEDGREKTKCKLCNHSANYHKNTTNLKDHLKRKHYLQLRDLQRQIRHQENSNSNQVSISDNQSQRGNEETVVEPTEAPPPAKKQRQLRIHTATQKEIDSDFLDRCLLRMIVTDYQPLSMVENKGFMQFVKLLQPNYNLPGKKMVSEKLLQNEHQLVYNNMIEKLAITSHLSITTDLWVSDSNKCYITVTGHFICEFELKSYVLGTEELTENYTAQNIADAISYILSKYSGSIEKLSMVVTDNTSNMKKAVTECLEKLHHPCVANILNLSVQESISTCNGLDSVLSKCRALYSHFKHNNIASYTLIQTQEQMNLPILKLKKDIPTRWTSLLFMIEQFSQMRIPLSLALNLLKNAPENLDANDWDIVDDTISLLKLILKVTEELSGEDYTTLSRIIPIIRGLQFVLMSKNPTSEVGVLLRTYLLEVVARRLGGLEAQKSVALCTLLDPRFKKTGFGSPENADNAEKWLTEILASQIAIDSAKQLNVAKASTSCSIEETVNQPVDVEPVNDDGNDIWKIFDQKVVAATSSSTHRSSATLQVKQYLDMPLIHRKENPIIFWKTYSKTFPVLSQLAFEYLCIPATSVPSERIFSKAGFLMNQRRNRLSPKKLDEIIFLNQNMDL